MPHFDKGRNIFIDLGTALYHDMAAYMGELMAQYSSAENSEVVDDDLSGYLRRIGDNDVIAQFAIVGDMYVSHEQAVIPDNGFPFRCGSTVYSYIFAQGGVVSYFGSCFFSLEFEILWNGRNDGSREDGAIFTDTGAFENGRIWHNTGSVADDDIFVNSNKRPYFYVFTDLCIGIYIW